MYEQFLTHLQSLLHQHWVAWALFFAYLVLAWVVAALAKRLMKGLVSALTARSTTTLDDRLVQAAAGPLRFLVFMVGLSFALGALSGQIESFQVGGAYAERFGWANRISTALIIFAVARLVNGLIRAGLDWYLHELAAGTQATWDNELLPVVRRISALIVYFIAISMILPVFGQDVTALITTAGVASLAVALAAQDTLSNMLGGFVILMDRPFKVGDVIELADGKVGEVVEIGLRSTRIRQFDGNALVMPNKDMANSRIVNFALPTPRAAIRQTIGVDYSTDVEHAKAVLRSVIEAHPEVLKDPAPGVAFTRFGESQLDLFFSAWVESYRDRFRITDELNIAILKAFRENGISIPFPQRDVHLFVKSGQLTASEKK